MLRPRHIRLAALGLAASASVAVSEEPAPAAPAKTRRHPVVLWTFDDDLARPGFADAAKALGAPGVEVFPGHDPAPIVAQGLGWYADHAAMGGTLALREREWQPAWDRVWAARTEAWPAADVRARPVCLRDPAVRKEMEDGVRAAARHAKQHGALWISLADEPGLELRANPGDWCLCDRCVAAYPGMIGGCRAVDDALRAQMNGIWGTDYPDVSSIRPWTTAAIRAREIAKPPAEWNLSPWISTRRFQDASFAATVRDLIRIAHEEAPGVPVGLCGTQAPSAWGGYDYATLLPGVTFVEPYDIGLALPVCRDLGESGAVIAQTLFPDGGDGRVSRWRLWRGIARGANATIVWSSHDALRAGKDGRPEPTPWGAAVADDLRRLSAAGGLGERLAATAPLREGIEVLLSQPSIQVRWMLDSIVDNNTWLRRFGSHEAIHSTAIKSREAAWRALARRGVRFVSDAQTALGDGTAPRVVVLPDAIALDDDVRDRIAALAKRKVAVIADVLPAQFDGWGRGRKEGGIDGAVLDPGFAKLESLIEKTIGPPVLRATAKRADGAAAPEVEIGLRESAAARWAVCVPVWEARSKDDGSAKAEIPSTSLTIEFAFGDGRARAVRDEIAGRDLGEVASWSVTLDAAAPCVWSWPAK